jgi:hypothetical protein
MTSPAHPGTITITNVAERTTETVPYDSVPPRQRFVMLNAAGTETEDPAQAKETIPIVAVRVVMLDGLGELATGDAVKVMRILEYGPGERLLRSTTMTR